MMSAVRDVAARSTPIVAREKRYTMRACEATDIRPEGDKSCWNYLATPEVRTVLQEITGARLTTERSGGIAGAE